MADSVLEYWKLEGAPRRDAFWALDDATRLEQLSRSKLGRDDVLWLTDLVRALLVGGVASMAATAKLMGAIFQVALDGGDAALYVIGLAFSTVGGDLEEMGEVVVSAAALASLVEALSCLSTPSARKDVTAALPVSLQRALELRKHPLGGVKPELLFDKLMEGPDLYRDFFSKGRLARVDMVWIKSLLEQLRDLNYSTDEEKALAKKVRRLWKNICQNSNMEKSLWDELLGSLDQKAMADCPSFLNITSNATHPLPAWLREVVLTKGGGATRNAPANLLARDGLLPSELERVARRSSVDTKIRVAQYLAEGRVSRLGLDEGSVEGDALCRVYLRLAGLDETGAAVDKPLEEGASERIFLPILSSTSIPKSVETAFFRAAIYSKSAAVSSRAAGHILLPDVVAIEALEGGSLVDEAIYALLKSPLLTSNPKIVDLGMAAILGRDGGFQRLQDLEDDVFARSILTKPDFLARLVETIGVGADMATYLAKLDGQAKPSLRLLAGHEDAHVRAAVAANRSTEPDVLEALSGDVVSFVAAAALRNRSIEPSVLVSSYQTYRLSSDLLAAMAENERLPHAVSVQLVRLVRGGTLEALAQRKILTELSGNPRLTSDLIDPLVGIDKDIDTRLAFNIHASSAALDILYTGSTGGGIHSHVLLAAVAINPQTPDDRFYEILSDKRLMASGAWTVALVSGRVCAVSEPRLKRLLTDLRLSQKERYEIITKLEHLLSTDFLLWELDQEKKLKSKEDVKAIKDKVKARDKNPGLTIYGRYLDAANQFGLNASVANYIIGLPEDAGGMERHRPDIVKTALLMIDLLMRVKVITGEVSVGVTDKTLSKTRSWFHNAKQPDLDGHTPIDFLRKKRGGVDHLIRTLETSSSLDFAQAASG